MTRLTFDMKRLAPWLRLAFVAYLACTVVVAMAHQHHGATAGDCGLCTAAHTPALTAPSTTQLGPATANVTPIVRQDDRAVESTVRQASLSRAPPQAS